MIINELTDLFIKGLVISSCVNFSLFEEIFNNIGLWCRLFLMDLVAVAALQIITCVIH